MGFAMAVAFFVCLVCLLFMKGTQGGVMVNPKPKGPRPCPQRSGSGPNDESVCFPGAWEAHKQIDDLLKPDSTASQG